MAFLENNPGVALPSSAAPAPVSPDTAPTTSPHDANATEPTDTPTPPEEATASEPQPESDSATPTDPAAAPEAPAEPTTPTPETDAPAAAPACPEGETPLILYLDSGSTGEYESCAAATNGTAAYYFVARAGESEARTFALPEVHSWVGLVDINQSINDVPSFPLVRSDKTPPNPTTRNPRPAASRSCRSWILAASRRPPCWRWSCTTSSSPT